MRYSFTLENLNCAHCAEKIEEKISSAPFFKNVNFNFATKQLSFETEVKNPLDEIQRICDSIEDGVKAVDNNKNKSKNKSKDSGKKIMLLIVSSVLCAISFILHFIFKDELIINLILFVLCLAATLISGYNIFLKGIKNTIKFRIDETTLLFVAIIAAFCLGEFTEGAAVTVLFSLGEIIEDKAVESSRRDIEKLAQIRPETVTLIQNGSEITTNASDVKIGSEIIIKPYERVPLDCVILSGSSTVDNSALTGESVPVDVEQGSELLSGAINAGNTIVAKTTKEFSDSTATRILRLVEEASAQKGKSEKLISRFASVYTPIVMIISLVFALLPPLLGLGSFSDWLYRALVCLVASCPCSIVISVPLAYYSGIGACSRIGMLIKGGKYLEALANADAFVFDKTGTLTAGILSVEKVISCSDYSDDEILAFAAACEKYSSHPVALAIKEGAKSKGLTLPSLKNHSEIAGYGTSATFGEKKIVCGGKRIVSDSCITNADNSSIFLLFDGILVGSLQINDTLRDEAKYVLAKLKKTGVKHTVMLTGDGKENAEKVSNELDLSEYKAELLPEQKLDSLKEIKEKSKVVCFVGDGINDAPVLSASDCGIAMGFGSEAAIESADAVLSSGNLKPLINAIKIAKKTLATVKTNIIFSLLIKAAVIVLAVLGFSSMWMSVIADTGVSVVCVLCAARLLKIKT